MRPAWQIFQARELAGRMGSTPGSHMAAALVVRDLLAKNPGLDRTMITVNPATQEEWSGLDKPQAFVTAMQKMWSSIGVYEEGAKPVPETDAALRTLARTVYLTLPAVEIEAAKEIAGQSKLLPRFGAEIVKTTTGTEEIWGGGWTTNGGFGLRGFGSLRDELIANVAPERRGVVGRSYDEMAVSTATRREFVKNWQRVMQGAGLYDGAIDGLWGPKSEKAFVTVRPEAYALGTKLADLQAFRSRFSGLTDGDVVGAAISRDKWVSANLDRLPPRPTPGATPPTTTVTTTTTPEGTTQTEETVVITPVGSEAGTQIGNEQNGEAHRFDIILPDGGSETVTVTPIEEGAPAKKEKSSVWPWLLLGGAGLVGAVVLATRKGEAA